MLSKLVYCTSELKKKANWVPSLEDSIQFKYTDFKEVTENSDSLRIKMMQNTLQFASYQI
jgi:hypothetical protein